MEKHLVDTETKFSSQNNIDSDINSDKSTECSDQKLSHLLIDIDLRVRIFLDQLEYVPLKAAINNWLDKFDKEKQNLLRQYFDILFKKNILQENFADGKEFTIGGARHLNNILIINYIRQLNDIKIDTKESIITCYTSFISHLNAISYGWFARSVYTLNKAINPEFYDKNRALKFSFQDWRLYIDTLHKINSRDSLIARSIMSSSLKISDILNLTLQQIDFEKNSIKYCHINKKGIAKEIPVTYHAFFMRELKEYINETSNHRKNSQYLFITRNGKKLTRSRLSYSLAEASERANINKITPDTLKKIWTDLIQEGIKEKNIMQSKKWSEYVDSKI